MNCASEEPKKNDSLRVEFIRRVDKFNFYCLTECVSSVVCNFNQNNKKDLFLKLRHMTFLAVALLFLLVQTSFSKGIRRRLRMGPTASPQNAAQTEEEKNPPEEPFLPSWSFTGLDPTPSNPGIGLRAGGGSGGGGASPCSAVPPSSTRCHWQCFLPKARFALPAFSQGPLRVSNMTCGDFKLARITSMLEGPLSSRTLRLELQGLSFNCQARAQARILLFRIDKQIGITIGPQTRIGVVARAVNGGINITAVTPRFDITQLNIGRTNLPNGLRNLVERLFNSLSARIMTNLVNTQVQVLLSNLTTLANRGPPPLLASPAPPPLSLDLSKSLVQTVALTIPRFAPLLERVSAEISGRSLDGAALANLTGGPLAPKLVPLPGNLGSSCVWVTPNHVGIPAFEGLRFNMVVPTPQDVSIQSGLSNFHVTANVGITFTTPFGPTLALQILGSVKAANPHLDAHVWASVHQVLLQKTRYFGDLNNETKCPILQAILAKGIVFGLDDFALGLSLDPQGTTLSDDMITLINNLSEFALTALPPNRIAAVLSASLGQSGRDSLQEALQAFMTRAESVRRSCDVRVERAVAARATPSAGPPHPTESDFRGFWQLFNPNFTALIGGLCGAFVMTVGLTLFEFRQKASRKNTLLAFANATLLFSVAFFVIGALSNIAWVWAVVRNSPSSTSLSTNLLTLVSYIDFIKSSWRCGGYSSAITLIAGGLVVPALSSIGLCIVGLYAIYVPKPSPKAFKFAVALDFSGKFSLLVPVAMICSKVSYNLAIPLLGSSDVGLHFYFSFGFYSFVLAGLLQVTGGSLMVAFVKHRVGILPGSATSPHPVRHSFRIPILVQILMFLGLLGGLACVCYAMFRPVLLYRITGVASQLLDLLSPAVVTVREFTFLEMLSQIAGGTPPGWATGGMWALAIVVGAMAIGFVLLLPFLLFFAFFVVPSQKGWFWTLMLTCRALVATELWAVIMLGLTGDQSKLQACMMGGDTASLEALLRQFPGVFGGVTQIFGIQAFPLLGLWLLIIGAFTLLFLSIIIVSLWMFDATQERPSILYRAALCLRLIRRTPSADENHWIEMSGTKSENFAPQPGEMNQPLLSESQRIASLTESQRMALLTPTVSKRNRSRGPK